MADTGKTGRRRRRTSHGSSSYSSYSDSSSSSDDEGGSGAEAGPQPLSAFPQKMRLKPNSQKDRRRTSISAEAIDPEAAKQQIPVGTPKTADEIVRISCACRSNFLFRHLKPEQLEIAYGAMVRLDIPEGHDIIVQGDQGEYFYVVDSGEFAVFVDGVQVVVVEAGGSFGELALMYNAPRAATVTAKVDSVVYALDRVTFNITMMNAIVSKRDKQPPANIFSELDFLSSNGVNLTQLRDVASHESFDAASVIVRSGDINADKFYILMSGSVSILNSDGAPVVQLSAPDYFGELELIEFTSRKFSVIAETDVNVEVIDRINFIRLLMKCCADEFAAHRAVYQQ
ncbi:cAMP-dependent protein kinase regulatory subunit PkaR [Thecamonas trahens ATCC 50062]|uniref:cAMP-dependent protein kinase regulatory subunit PkaR n=1 Tax=Thecamonas trahens ATCC 50062 TaxID=461836 RepID=A0A0L0DL49_THETB|nr:cAMP-dependent protein kinase regulatory subunit PkaR [Thecamonas trahens ATCC 50062]KNC52756.1 cAMP-dependent protein kinase regulatory subunit PkaR [Thecamonas trahens ATCC 50062]|eukprot:XP_013755069.1 cAMP-dependent protein kinase regulatory subunit PkaR [Thecamonas trahens ATCC 50062]